MESYFENSDTEEDTIREFTPVKNIDTHKFYIKAKQDLNIEKFTVEKDISLTTSEQIYNSFSNPNMVLLIIEDMSLGLIMTDHIAKKFQYLKQTLEYREENKLSANQIPTYLNFPIKIIKIDKNWSTHNWNCSKIKRIYMDQLFDKFETYSLKETENYLKKHNWYKQQVCFNFLTALSWHGGEEKVAD